MGKGQWGWLIPAAILVGGCQGTDWSTPLEQAIAPRAALVPPKTISVQLPPEVPLFQPAEIRAWQTTSISQQGVWASPKGVAEVRTFYGQAFRGDRWQVLHQPPDNTADASGLFLVYDKVAQRWLSVAIAPDGADTQIFLHLSRLENNPLPPVAVSPPAPTGEPTVKPAESADPLQRYVRDLSRLGIRSQEDLNQPIRRREYVRWLIQTNNRLFADLPSRQVRPASPRQSARFTDVPAADPDFPFIQGAADAGLVPVSGKQFFPDRPLTREQLVQWKILLDVRRPLPPVSPADLKKITGLIDSDRISPAARSAVAADMQLGDLSNLRRAFGFRVQLQPQQVVTRLEALASLWSFGTAIDGRSAALVPSPE